jgi:hypothetical protein
MWWDKRWTWNNDYINPTVQSSILFDALPVVRCHLFIENGKIRFLKDCSHELAGQTVSLEPPCF